MSIFNINKKELTFSRVDILNKQTNNEKFLRHCLLFFLTLSLNLVKNKRKKNIKISTTIRQLNMSVEF